MSHITEKLSKRAIKDLYGISYPTLRSRFKHYGLEQFIGRRFFSPEEVFVIFKFLGKPQHAYQAAKRLNELFKQQMEENQELKKRVEDLLNKSPKNIKVPAEIDIPPLFELQQRHSQDPLHIKDALSRLSIIAIRLVSRKELFKEKKN